MKKCDLFPVLDNQTKYINQINALANVMQNAGGLTNHPENELRACLSIISYLSNLLNQNQESICKSVTELSIVHDCMNGQR
jgi:hypothetical protein